MLIAARDVRLRFIMITVHCRATMYATSRVRQRGGYTTPLITQYTSNGYMCVSCDSSSPNTVYHRTSARARVPIPHDRRHHLPPTTVDPCGAVPAALSALRVAPRGHGGDRLLIYSASCAVRSPSHCLATTTCNAVVPFRWFLRRPHGILHALLAGRRSETDSSGPVPRRDIQRRKMKRPVAPPFNVINVRRALAVCVAAALWTPAQCSDDSLRSALEAISDKIGATPSRVVYLSPGNDSSTARLHPPRTRHQQHPSPSTAAYATFTLLHHTYRSSTANDFDGPRRGSSASTILRDQEWHDPFRPPPIDIGVQM